MSTTPTGPPDTNATAATAATAAATVTPSDPKILLQITKNSEYFTTSKNPSYNVNVLSYYDGTNLKNTTAKNDVEKLLKDTKNNILLIENNTPIKMDSTNIESYNELFTGKIKPDTINQLASNNKTIIPVNTTGGKRKTIRKKSYKKSARRNLTRRS